MAPPTVRFAPSPTGRLHIGNARTALLNALFARARGGTFILRFDDTDADRSRTEFADAIAADLAWLGIEPARTVHQSRRFDLYAAAAGRLKAAGRLYPAYETADELERRRRRMQARGLPPVYDRAALALSDADRAALERDGRRPHWRFRLDSAVETWADLVRGPCAIDCASLSDPVLVREDGTYLYTLPSVVDDLDLAVTDVIRGEDHVTNTAVQIQIMRALGGAVPAFGHHNLLVNEAGEGLSKRSGAFSLGGLREAGIEPLAVAAQAVLTGSATAVQPVASLDALGALVDLARLSRAPARFDGAELAALSARTLHILPFDRVRARLVDRGIAGPLTEPFWLAVRGNLARFDEVDGWWAVVRGPLAGLADAEDAGFRAEAAAALPPGPWDRDTWGAWTTAVRAATGRKGRALFHPLRVALTGRESGPDLAALLPLIGPEQVRARLAAGPSSTPGR